MTDKHQHISSTASRSFTLIDDHTIRWRMLPHRVEVDRTGPINTAVSDWIYSTGTIIFTSRKPRRPRA